MVESRFEPDFRLFGGEQGRGEQQREGVEQSSGKPLGDCAAVAFVGESIFLQDEKGGDNGIAIETVVGLDAFR